MGVKPGQKLLVMNTPEGYGELLGRLPEGTALSLAPEGEYDFVQLFVRDSLELEAMGAGEQGGLEAGVPGGGRRDLVSGEVPSGGRREAEAKWVGIPW